MSTQWIRLINTPFAIRRDVLDERQAMANHSQTLDRLNERGGLCAQEAWAIATKSRYGQNRDAQAAWDYLLNHAKKNPAVVPQPFLNLLALSRRVPSWTGDELPPGCCADTDFNDAVEACVNYLEPEQAAKTDVVPAPTVTVDAASLRSLLHALIGPPHLIRELQATRGLPGPANPIDQLIEEFNAQAIPT